MFLEADTLISWTYEYDKARVAQPTSLSLLSDVDDKH